MGVTTSCTIHDRVKYTRSTCLVRIFEGRVSGSAVGSHRYGPLLIKHFHVRLVLGSHLCEEGNKELVIQMGFAFLLRG